MSSFWHFIFRQKAKLWVSLYILTISFFAAKSFNLIFASYFLPLPLETNSTPTRSPSSNRVSSVEIPSILSRNIFDSQATARKLSPKEPEVDSNELRPSTLNAELLGTVVYSNSKYSAALIKDRSSNAMRYFSIGESILGAQIMKIERFRIIIQNQGRLETMELQSAKSQLSSLSPVSRPSSRSETKDVAFEEIGPGRYLIPESSINDLMSNLPQIMRDARAVPNIGSDNRIDGFKMLEIKPKSIYEKIGLQNGDIVRRINDEDLNSVEKGMSLFTALRNEKTISIDIDRNGSRLNYTYEIR